MIKNLVPAAPRSDDAPASLAARVTDQIRQAILDGEVQLGEALSELKLSAALGVSRTPVREALNALQREGLIDIRPQSGSFVFLPSEEDVGELCEFRRILETTALRLSFARRRDETLLQLRTASDAMEQAQRNGEHREMARADSAFHQALARNCANAYVVEAYKLVSGRVAALLTHNVSGPEPLRDKSIAEHRAIIAAFAKGDLDAAEDILDEHISRMRVGFRSARRRELKALAR